VHTHGRKRVVRGLGLATLVGIAAASVVVTCAESTLAAASAAYATTGLTFVLDGVFDGPAPKDWLTDGRRPASVADSIECMLALTLLAAAWPLTAAIAWKRAQ
jgi:hypothetical protein